MASDLPVLVGCGHGTRDAAGRRTTAQLRLDVAALRPGLEVVAASVDVQKPALPDVVARLTAAGRRCVVVPLLLSAGYHVHTDVAQAVAASGGLAVAADALGPDDVLVEVLLDRLRENGFHRIDGADAADVAVVLAAAGSSDARAVAAVEQVGSLLAQRVGAPVTTAYLSAAQPRVADVVGALRAAGRRVVVANYLLSPGFFADRLARLGSADADPDAGPDESPDDAGGCGVRVTDPLAPHPLLADLVLRRYDAAVATFAAAEPSAVN